MVEVMYVVLNLVLSAMSPPFLVRPISTYGGEVMDFGSFAFGVSLVS